MAQALTQAFQGDGITPQTGPLVTTTLAVQGMHCGACMRKVENALGALPGVVSARANLSASRVVAVHRAPQVASTDLADALGNAGFKAAELIVDAIDPQRATDQALLQRTGVAGFAAANIMLLSVSVWSGATGDMTPAVQALFHWLSALIALPAVGYAGTPFFRSAIDAIRNRRLNMDVPISLGVLLATGMSLYQTTRGSEQVYFDAAVTLLFFLLIGRTLDQSVRRRAAGAAANLLGLRASTAAVLQPDGTTKRLGARALEPGMRILTVAGERFAVDGRLVKGEGQIDASLVTGESVPVAVRPGDLLYAGTLNLSGTLEMQATATDENTLLAEIGRLMASAEQARGRYVRLADRAARFYAPAVHILGLATLLGWLALGHGWEMALTAAIAVLIITCPCALALAVPVVQVAATSRLFAQGVLVKAPDALERLAEVDTIVFDKTGTLTRGEPCLIPDPSLSRAVLLDAASLAAASRHPYARAIVRAAEAAELVVRPADAVTETPGFGLEASAALGSARLGSAAWCGVEAEGSDLATVWYRRGDAPAVPLTFQDRLRSDAKSVVACLHGAGFRVGLLSGDRSGVVAAVASAAGINEWRGEVLPAGKLARLARLEAEGCRVLMVGDGLNDAPALAAGHASLSPANAADIAQTAADAIIQVERLGPVLEAIGVARAAKRLALQNFAIAIGYNAVFVPLAILGLVTPLLAAIAMSASSIAVTANAIRLRRMRLGIAL
jgi:Cu2+-exporting ATPase